MDEIIPWDEWVSVIEPYYPRGKCGRPPMGIEKMLRMHLLQIGFTLSDPATEDAIYDSYAMRKFTGIDFILTSPDVWKPFAPSGITRKKIAIWQYGKNCHPIESDDGRSVTFHLNLIRDAAIILDDMF